MAKQAIPFESEHLTGVRTGAHCKVGKEGGWGQGIGPMQRLGVGHNLFNMLSYEAIWRPTSAKAQGALSTDEYLSQTHRVQMCITYSEA